MIEKMCGSHRHIEIARLLDRLATIQRLGDGEFPGAVLQQPGDPEEIFRSLGSREPAPRLESGGRGLIGRIDIGRPCQRDFRQLLLVAGADRIEVFASPGGDEFAVDEEAVSFLDESVSGFRRGIVFPEITEEKFAGGRAGGLSGGHG